MIFEEKNDIGDWPSELLRDSTSVCENDENMISLTFQESQTRPSPQPENIDTWVPYEGQIFNSHEDAYNFYSLFAKKSGFSIRRDHIYKCSKSKSGENPLGVYRREFVCHCAGNIKHNKVADLERQRNRKGSRCNCSAKMWIAKRNIGFEEQWAVTYFNNSHNHELLDDKEVQYLPAYRNILASDQMLIMLLSKADCPISLIIRVLELEKGIDAGHLPFLEKYQEFYSISKWNW